ncbi:hypothetical protein TNCV_4365131 [Trichonephila clavipes]|nr:hypothetical protein TNCV_4365131 [Trichonephila clavipes]
MGLPEPLYSANAPRLAESSRHYLIVNGHDKKNQRDTQLCPPHPRLEKKESGSLSTRRVKNRDGSLGHSWVVKPLFTKDCKPLEEMKRLLGYLRIVTPVLI